ncbi:hypothetical protein JTB14_011500 [Gonioctena quinquepunctata]|nr:hypothetical protein JTB14_011500 [Gonioctena quinquepunctata]
MSSRSKRMVQAALSQPSEGALHTPPEFLPQLTLLTTSSTLVSEPTNSEVNTAIENVSKLALKKRIRRKHTCPFCNLKCGNFSRHLERNHEDETSVQEFLCLDKTSTKRKKLIDKIRREGEFCTAETIPVTQQNKEPTEFICASFVWVTIHRNVCVDTRNIVFQSDPAKRFNAKSEGQTVMAGHFGPNDILRSSGLLVCFERTKF